MTTTPSRMIFVNLAVKDLGRAVDFFSELGFSFDPRFTDETATCMIVSDQAFVMLLVEDRFRDFTKKELADPATQTEAILALSADSRDAVDDMVAKAQAGGGGIDPGPKQDYGFMYGRSFEDPDGHIWEVMWMDLEAAKTAMAGQQTAAA